jgi:hypothetical protein
MHTELELCNQVSIIFCFFLLHFPTYPSHTEITKNTFALSTSNTPVFDLSGSRITVHLRQLQLRLSACALWESCVADDEAQCLS